ncbi:MAG: ABC transporter ATP-binding protein [Bacteroidales bacterium]|nr:ABC transporter ATP-binding protein [Bacteroidales bacterium]
MNNRQLHIERLTNGFFTGNKQVVLQDNISASLQPGNLVCLLGPNGAGKSTLMRTLSGFQKILQGAVLFSGQNLDAMSLKQRSKEVAVVFTGQLNDPFLTAYEVVSMGRFPYASFYGRLKKQDLHFIDETLERLHVYHLRDKVFYQLSDGEKQKMLLARALVQDTPFLFLDEPVAFIDSPGKIEIMEWLAHFAHEQNKGVLITTHDIELALDYADQLWLLNRDKAFQKGVPEDLVLKGLINKYFDREEVVFDPQKGRFGTDHPKAQEVVYLKGDQLEIQWLCRALSRIGKKVKKVSLQENDIPFYFFTENHYTFSDQKGNELHFNTIGDVIAFNNGGVKAVGSESVSLNDK